MEISTTCLYNATPTTQATGFDCTTTLPYLENINASTGEFNLQKTWDYGELFISFLLIFVILVWSAGSIFKFFFENFIRIKRKND